MPEILGTLNYKANTLNGWHINRSYDDSVFYSKAVIFNIILLSLNISQNISGKKTCLPCFFRKRVIDDLHSSKKAKYLSKTFYITNLLIKQKNKFLRQQQVVNRSGYSQIQNHHTALAPYILTN